MAAWASTAPFRPIQVAPATTPRMSGTTTSAISPPRGTWYFLKIGDCPGMTGSPDGAGIGIAGVLERGFPNTGDDVRTGGNPEFGVGRLKAGLEPGAPNGGPGIAAAKPGLGVGRRARPKGAPGGGRRAPSDTGALSVVPAEPDMGERPLAVDSSSSSSPTAMEP